MPETQKVTIHLPRSLLQDALNETGLGITETVKAGLEQIRLRRVYKNILDLRGKIDLQLDLDELRKDKDEA
jgi:hypothetical protein